MYDAMGWIENEGTGEEITILSSRAGMATGPGANEQEILVLVPIVTSHGKG